MSVITTTNGKRNVLSGKDRFYLNRWVADNAKKLDGLTVDEASRKVSKVVGFTVTPTNLRVARKNTGADFKLRSGPKAVRIIRQEAASNHLHTVAAAVYDLYRAVGSDVPAALEAAMRELRQH